MLLSVDSMLLLNDSSANFTALSILVLALDMAKDGAKMVAERVDTKPAEAIL